MNRKIILWLTAALILMFCCAFSWNLPEIEIPESSTVIDINGQPIKGLSEQNRISIGLEEIPDSFIKAVIAVEDKNFYNHHGIDITGIFRAILINIKEHRIAAGGSTITQQTAKNLFLSNERTIVRKIKEFFYALQLERNYSKDEILTMYCNSIYFGQGAYGIEVAARTFFGKNARDLNLSEASLLAGLPRWPSRYNPYINPDEAVKRQTVVLQRMVEEEMISKDQMRQVLAVKLNFRKVQYMEGDAPYFIAMVKEYLSEKYGERMVFQGGLQIFTTLDLYMQKAANKAYMEVMKDREKDLQAALVAMDVSSGHIRALIGGRDFTASSYNRVFAKRQPGSTFKPFMYSLAIAWGFRASDMMMCEEVEFELPNGDIYRPKDFGDEPYHWREFTLKEAVMKSDNVIAVRLNNILGPENTARYAGKFGFTGIKPVLSLPLGSSEVTPMDMAAAYSVFANQGIYSKPVFILKVVDKNGNVLEENKVMQRQAIGADNAYIITDMLKGVLEPGGTGQTLKNIVGRTAAGKTGTTDNFKDAWFVGYTPRLCCAVWVGYDREKNVNLPGSLIAGPIWANFIREASVKLPEEEFKRPDNINIVNICLDSGMVACESCPRRMEMAFIDGTEPKNICYNHLPGIEWWINDENYLYEDLPGLYR